MDRKEIEEHAGDAVMFLEPESLDSALIGWFSRCGQPPVAVYSWDLLVEALEVELGDYGAAVEWIDFNIEGAWLGERTPAIMHRPETEDFDNGPQAAD